MRRRGAKRGGGLLLCVVLTAVFLLSSLFFMFDSIIMHPAPTENSNGRGNNNGHLRSSTSPPPSAASSSSNGTGSDRAIFVAQQKSKYAYVTLLSGIDASFRYRGFLYNVLIMRRALLQAGSTADFIALVGYSDSGDVSPYAEDVNLLRAAGVIIYTLPRLLDATHKLGFAEMALLKITPYSFTQYSRVQFFDGDVMPTQSLDCYFELPTNTFTIGAVSPLNSGWYLAIPSQEAYEYMRERAVWRLGRDWDKAHGWKEPMPPGLWYRGGKEPCVEWQFNGADMDQGLFLHYFVLNHGNALLVDTTTRVTRLFERGLLHSKDAALDAAQSLACCGGKLPTNLFAHFTGRSKPWMMDADAIAKARKGSFLDIWKGHLDALHLSVNSSNIAALGYGSPLGFWNAGFPKGGFKKKDAAQ